VASGAVEADFARLEVADARERAEAILALLEASPGRPLDLSARGGLRANLDGIDLGRASLRARIAAKPYGRDGSHSGAASGPAEGRAPQPVWWDPPIGGVVLRGANLRGARLAGALLGGADLRGADLRDAVLAGADLRGARLEQALLAGADLAGADLRGAMLGHADLRGAMLEDAILRRAGLRFAKLAGGALDAADLRGADLWGAELEEATLVKADLRATVLRETQCRRATLAGALLRRADLGQADFSEADLSGADLRGAQTSAARFDGARLRDARLDGLDLSNCELAHAHLCGVSLTGARLRAEQLASAIGEEVAREFGDARKGYLILERYFQEVGDPGAASWAYRRRRRMQKCEARRLARVALAERRPREAAAAAFDYACDQLVEWLCDYGESIPRILLAMLSVYAVFTLVYGVTGAVVRVEPTPSGPVATPTRNLLDLAIFSLMAITAPGNTPSGMQPLNDWVILLSGFESLLGIAFTGLLGFVLGNLVRR
jgi:uncharacterized protein YjbI with pentapeptide repeats